MALGSTLARISIDADEKIGQRVSAKVTGNRVPAGEFQAVIRQQD